MVKQRQNSGSPYYGLGQVRQYVSTGNFIVTKKAKKTAHNNFGWSVSDIKKALLKLQPKHFYKSAKNWCNPHIYVDYYKAYGLLGENIYTHFHVDDNKLIISSFKEI